MTCFAKASYQAEMQLLNLATYFQSNAYQVIDSFFYNKDSIALS